MAADDFNLITFVGECLGEIGIEKALALMPETVRARIRRRGSALIADLRGKHEIATNEHLTRAARFAWVEATKAIFDAAKRDGRAADEVPFEALVRKELNKIHAEACDPNCPLTPSPIDAHVEELTWSVGAHVAPGIASPDGHSLNSGFIPALARLSCFQEKDVPAIYVALARSGISQNSGPSRDFATLVFSHFADLFKSGAMPEAWRAWQMAHGELVRALAADLGPKIDVVLQGIEELKAGQDQLKTGQDETNRRLVAIEDRIISLAALNNVSRDLVRRFLSEIFRIETPEDQVDTLLQRLIEDWKNQSELLSRLSGISNQDVEAGKLLAQAKAAYEASDVDSYRSLAKDVAERLEAADREDEAVIAQVEARRAARRENLIVARRLSIEAAKASLDPQATADALWALFEVESPSTMPQPERFQAARALQDEWYVRGRGKGLNFDLAVSISIARRLNTIAIDRNQRGILLNVLGNALSALGVRESEEVHLEEAIEVYSKALQEHTRDFSPIDWALTQHNLGNTLWRLGERESETGRLKEAAMALRAALEERTRERDGLTWAMTCNSLGSVIWRLGEREASSDRLEEAIAIFRLALEERTRERVPLDWAMTQNNLGLALWRLGQRENNTDRLIDSVEAFRKAIEATIEGNSELIDPIDLSAMQDNLGNALLSLGVRGNDITKIQEAVLFYRSALTEKIREVAPIQWASTLNNLSTALAQLGELQGNRDNLLESISNFRRVLEIQVRSRDPLKWAMTQNNIGTALTKLAELGSGTLEVAEACAAYRSALEERTRNRVPLGWAMSTAGYAAARLLYAVRKDDLVALREAIELIDAARQVFRDVGHEYFLDYCDKIRNRAQQSIEKIYRDSNLEDYH